MFAVIKMSLLFRCYGSPGRESESSCSMDIGVKVNSMQAFVLARNRYSSGSQLYFVRWGSESVTDDAVQSGRVHRIYNDGNMYAPFLCLRISYLPNLFFRPVKRERSA